MITIPSPLHPALVHFPIVLVLVGTVVALVAVFVRRSYLTWIAAGLLAFGAAGAVAAAWSGGGEKELVGELSATAEQLLDQHEEWGERTRTLAIVAAFLALGAAAVRRWPAISRTIAVATACAALAASYCVVNAGHYGGQLVYKHGAGINTAAEKLAGNPVPSPERGGGQAKGDDD